MGKFDLPTNATYLEGGLPRSDRQVGNELWHERQLAVGAEFFEITESSPDFFTAKSEHESLKIFLRDQPTIEAWLLSLASPVFIDITSLSLPTWAPILRAAISAQVLCRFVYVEPAEYVRPTAQSDFSLSEYTGIGAVPGFAPLTSTTNESPPLVALLGFEGSRLARVINSLEPPIDLTHPIIGVPGYQTEFPFFAYEGNRRQLEEKHLHSRVVLARANCPFDAFEMISKIHSHLGGSRLQVAPIGTKPHALGATLFAIANEATIELVYDHPKPAVRPTLGASRTCVYYVAEFVESDLFRPTNLNGAA